MTAPVQMTHPTLNRDAFQEALDRVKINADNMEVKTRSEFQLQIAEQDMRKLIEEGEEIRTELDWIKQLEEQIASTRKTLEVNEADNAIARRGLLAQINVLRENGIELPKNQEKK